MPQHAKGPRLYRRPDTGIYLIRDTGRGEHSTGTRDRAIAEKALGLYLAERDRSGGPATAHDMTVAEALNIYGSERAAKAKDPARIGYAIDALLSFWGDLPVSAIRQETIDAYAQTRRKVVRKDKDTGAVLETAPCAPGTIRREIGTLAAAVAYCSARGRLVEAPKVPLPPKPEPKDRWLTRFEAARLLRAAWRNPEAKHLARFILIGLYTGTRKTAILRLRYMPNVSGGHVDTERGVLYRKAQSQAETKKKQTTITIAPRLLAHLRRWEGSQARWVVSYEGQGVASIKTGWRTAVRDAGLEGTGVTPHTLRHTAITWACQSGRASLWELAGYFGVSMETMQKTYAHHHPDHQKDAVAAVGSGGRKL